MTEDQYDMILKRQDGGCAICHNGTSFSKHAPRLFVDHNHQTGRIRGLLCMKCNFAVGLCDDNPERLEAVIAYLKR